MNERKFRMVDGEASPDGKYHLLVAGGRKCRPEWDEYLHTVEVFEFLLNLPKEDYLVGYYLTYDATNWLCDVSEKKRDRIYFEDIRSFGNYTFWKQYGIWHIPGQFFRVCRLDPKIVWPAQPKVLEGSSRTVNEVSGWWRAPFLHALESAGIGTKDELALITRGKAARGKALLPPKEEEAYCKLECRLGAKMMERLRRNCLNAGFPLSEWRGPGTMASFMLNQHLIPKRPKNPTRPARIDVSHEEHRYPDDSRWRMGVMTAGIGGRIENGVVGRIEGLVFENDRRSSYPAGLKHLPCPRHTNWVKFRGEPKGWRWYLAQGSWRSKERIKWGPLPTRTKDQAIVYPSSVEGWWWSPELENLEGFQFKGGWGADKECDCEPWAFVDEVYQRRLELGAAGDPLKGGLNAIPGKLAQRKYKNSAYWRDLPLAGLVFSQTRRAVRDVMDDDTIMVLTDAVYTTKPLAVPQSTDMGDWQTIKHPNGLFLVQPGIVWSPDKTVLKARGFARETLNEHAEKIRASWEGWNPLLPPPSYTMPVDLFVTHRAAQVLNEPEMFGRWKRMNIPLSFDWMPRRHSHVEMRDGHVVTFAPDRHQKSMPYDPSLISEMERLDILMQGMPDG